ncbi:MAG: PhzF family phenazine biosynthesis protein, partial [Nitrospinae bacterium]|nr:PhzF family phenazine biosynthesis protein [Nitrospinota bacterium]
MGIPIFQVDAFTDKPFQGNPAAVCLLPSPREEGWMQAVAGEMNLSETAFLLEEGGGHRLRWFTPVTEVDLCGHATLASAHALWESGRLPSGKQARFHTRSGLLTAELKGGWIEMDFPSAPPQPIEPPEELARALGVEPRSSGYNQTDYLVEVESPETLRAMKPDFKLLGALPVRGVIVTCVSDSSKYEFISRFFAPRAGIDEDPVTGSAHCCLAPYWAGGLRKKAFTAYQASPRGGVLRVRLNGGRVTLAGQA